MELRKSFLLKYLDFYNRCQQEYNVSCSLEIKHDEDGSCLVICLSGTKNCFHFNKDFKFYFHIFLEDLKTYFCAYYDYESILDSESCFINIFLYEKDVY